MESRTALRLIQEWAAFHRPELEANWLSARAGRPLVWIGPLELGDAMNGIPLVVRAEYRGDYKIAVTFNDGLERTLDFAPWLKGPVFEPLRDPAYFRRFFIDGGTVTWPNGADIAPETIYARANSTDAA
jgi:hypothetical protein